jgi:hypothetical protein
MNKNVIFEQNLNALSKKDPDLARRVRETTGNGNYKIIRSKTGHPNVLVERDSGWVVLYDNEDPLKYARAYLEGLNIKHAPIVVFMGMGLGYHLDQFFRMLSEDLETKEIVIFEKDVELFRLALEVGDFLNILTHPHVHFFVGKDSEESFVRLRTDIFIREVYALRSIKILPLPASVILDNDYYIKAVETVKKAARQVMIMVGNDSFDSLVGLENMFANLRHIVSNPGIKSLYGKFRGKSGILVAAGPSLNKNMHLLNGLRDRALIISCDASFIPIMKKGIHPHLVSSLERTPGVDLFYSGIDDFSGTYFIALPVLMPETIDAFKGRKFIAYRMYSYFDWLGNDKGSLAVGTSVANLAFKILMELGCDPIILIGQDLAYAEDGDTHVKGDIFGSRSEGIHKRPLIELEGNDGKPVKSEKMWEVMKLTYEEDIASYQGTCINATEGGARIIGAEVMPFSEAIERYCGDTFQPQAILDEVYDRVLADIDVDKALERIYFKTSDTRGIVDKTIDDFQKALDEACLVEEEVIQPFIEGNNDGDVDMERLLSVERKWLDLSATMATDKTLHDITAQTLQAYDIWLASELCFLKDIYTSKEILSMARVRKMKEWFAVLGSFLVCTRDILSKTERVLADSNGSSAPQG